MKKLNKQFFNTYKSFNHAIILIQFLHSFCTMIFTVTLIITISIANSPKESKVKLDILTDIDMFAMVEKCVRGRICHAIHR